MKMKDKNILGFESTHIPVSFKVIGVGESPVVTSIIERVKAFGYDCVECLEVKSRKDCIPVDVDKMAFIVSVDNDEEANAIAASYHDAGVLTIGLLSNPDITCFDSVLTDSEYDEVPEVIKALLQPIVFPGIINYDFSDLCIILRDTHYFNILIAEGNDVESFVINLQHTLHDKGIEMDKAQHLSVHVYFNRHRQPPLNAEDMVYLSDMLSKIPETVDIMWSVNYDDTLPKEQIRLTMILSGIKED